MCKVIPPHTEILFRTNSSQRIKYSYFVHSRIKYSYSLYSRVSKFYSSSRRHKGRIIISDFLSRSSLLRATNHYHNMYTLKSFCNIHEEIMSQSTVHNKKFITVETKPVTYFTILLVENQNIIYRI